MDNSYLEIVNQRKQIEIANIKKCNEYTNKYGLILSDNQISNLLEKIKICFYLIGKTKVKNEFMYANIL